MSMPVTDRQADGQTYQKYSSEPHKTSQKKEEKKSEEIKKSKNEKTQMCKRIV